MSDEDYRRGYRDGFKDGRAVGIEESTPITFPSIPKVPGDFMAPNRCSVCQMEMRGPYGYVCQNPNCPSRVVLLNETSFTRGTD